MIEALMAGGPVICSDYCGAADLIKCGFNGDVFKCDSFDSLTNVLNKWIPRGPLKTSLKEEIRSWFRYIDGDSLAQYFIKIINHLKKVTAQAPKAPWFE